VKVGDNWGGVSKAGRAEAGQSSWEGQRAPSHHVGDLGNAVSSPAASRTEPRPPNGFHTFSVL